MMWIYSLNEKMSPSHIKLSSPVKHIEWGKDVLVAGPGCRITLTSGDVVEADHVIFTPSLGVLKALASEMFMPPLPPPKMKAIRAITASKANPVLSLFHNWEASLVGFYSAYLHPTVLCGWITGGGALAMEQTAEEEVARRCIAYLRKRLPSKYKIPDAVFFKRSTWGTNVWTRGSYSFRSLKTEAAGALPADLAEPLVDLETNTPLVCFAGEASHDCYYSTVHGALETGWREADRLIKHFSSVVKRPSRVQVPAKGRGRYTVVIVGAGAASVGAARELTAQGINSVLILEASDRVGGRIHTVAGPPEGVVELGAQWIHGEKGNILYQFAKSRNLLHHHVSVDGKGRFVMEGGKEIDNKIVEEVLEVMEEADKECCGSEHRETATSSLSPSFGHVLRKVFYDYLERNTSDTPEIRRIKEALFDWAKDNACDSLHQLSAGCWGSYKFCEGENNMNPKNGFLSMLKALLAETTAVVKLNSEVECIDYSSEVTAERTSFLRPDGVTFPVIVRCRQVRKDVIQG
ncbi:Peroxisomal N(1)-acetyl-spermine/spermidine oxidase [Chionoecetes opilio]|uniref:Peroxisomal N(1)-acetyl-spermine/spermidine oxidase n=1 Tax=Chionoecetes opilio TaxID=41210 RepID=A0A8J4Y7I2_CHIOP|nr:Peroxisomal N(1)-acetyl-spermine/spermidine oxidase [Chionoecetes opilio]